MLGNYPITGSHPISMNRILLFASLLFSVAASAQRLVKTAPATHAADKTISSSIQRGNTNAWDEQEPYVNGFARVLSNNHFSFIDKNGKLIAPLQFEDARNFTNKRAAVKKGDKWGFIGEDGKLLIPYQYEIAFDFTESVTPVFANKKWSLINVNGIAIKQLDITACYGFNNGKAKVIKDGRIGFMSTLGDINYTGETIQQASARIPAPANNVVFPCPDNIDFEDGDLSSWNCFTGIADSVGNTNVITVTPSAPIANRHRIINRVMPSAIDPYGMFATNPPDGSNHAVKLGNTRIGGEAERIQYVIRIPANDSNFSIRYDYAVVFQDPGHSAWTQPRFTAKLFDSTLNAYIECASFEYIATSGLPGFMRSSVDTSVIYKDWASVFISLRGHAGQTLYLEFTTADCVRKGHWGYAYVDVESTCGHAVDMNYECATGIADLTAPPGFQTYNWWNHDYSTLYGSGPHIVLNPAPATNSTIWLEMIPFSDFGCRDSMPVTFDGTFTPHFDVSERVGVCAPHSFTFYNRDIPSLSATWDFGDGSPLVSGDTVTHVYNLPGTYTVTLTVTMPGGCNGTFQDIVKVVQPTASFNYSGGNFCNTNTVSFNTTISNGDMLIYHFGDGDSLSTTQTSIAHTYSSAGIYVPYLTLISSQGCRVEIPGTDTIRIEDLQPNFSINQERNCGSARVDFKDISTSFSGIVQAFWDFGDGDDATGSTVSHTYSAAGNYNVQLIIVSTSGCRDTLVRPINVAINSLPVATITGPVSACIDAPVSFNSNIVSVDAVNSLEWSSPNGTNSGASYTTSFTQAGSYTIQLIAGTINGCFDTTTHVITVSPVAEMIQPGNLEICNDATVADIVFNSSVPGVTYSWTNNNDDIGLAANGSVDINSFTATNTSNVSITATITVTPALNGCTGNPKTFTITVLPVASVNQPDDQSVCNRGTTTTVLFGSRLTSVPEYNWTNDQPGIGLAASGTGNIPSFTAVNTGGVPVVATILITPSSAGCIGDPKSFTITVNPTPDMSTVPNQTICRGAATNPVQFESTVNTATYEWTNSLPAIGLAATGNGNIAPFNTINNSASAQTATIFATSLAYGCHGNPASFTIEVNPIPDVDQPTSQSVCTGTTTSLVDFTGSVAGTVYNWTNNIPSIGLPANGTGDLLPFNPNNSSNTDLVATITVTPEANGCVGEAKDFSITILPSPGMIQPLNQFQCNGETTAAMNFISVVPGANFSWVNSLPSIGLPASGTGNIPAFTTNNPGSSTVTAAITVTASTNSCPGNPKTFYITVDPSPNIAQPVNKTVCSGETVGETAFSGSVIGTTYSWINSEASIGLAPNGFGDVPAFTAVNNTNFPITAIIQVTGSANSCGSAVTVFTITVNPLPKVDAPADQVVCNGFTTNPIVLTGPVSGTTFSWKNNAASIGLPVSGNGDIPSFTATNTTNTPVTATILVYGSNNNNCEQVLDTLTITVNPSAAVQASNNQDICLGNSVQLLATGATQYSWSPAIGLNCTNCPNPIATPLDSVLYKVEAMSALGCPGYDSVYLMVRKPFEMRTPPNDTVCAGRSVNLSANNAHTYQWSPAEGLNRTDIANPTATPTATTRYRVIGRDAYGCFTDTGYVTIAVGPKPTVNIGADLTTVNGSPVTFNPVIENGPIVHYSWTPASQLSCSDCPTPTGIVNTNTLYTLTVENSFGCSAVDSIFVSAMCQKAEVFVPNAFTPDGDGLNDVLTVRGTGISVKSFRVFNRWGNMVFEKTNFAANDAKYGWDGKVKGVPATPDVYVYTAEVICDNGTVYTYKGNTTILK